MNIVQGSFGTLPDGRAVDIFTLDGGAGVSARIMTYGGIIVSLRVPDRRGRFDDVVIGLPALDAYLARRNYFGAIIGRVANRTRNGTFTLNGRVHRLYVNEHGIHIHGGKDGFNVRLWSASQDRDRLKLEYLSPDGEENYPGNVQVKVWYSITNCDFCIEYEAETDKPTPINLTNHSYFNLNGFAGDILAHEVTLKAEAYNPVDATRLPTGETIPLAGTPFDFISPKAFGRDINQVPGGYDHNVLFIRETHEALEWLAEVHDPDSGRVMSMATTEPCVQFYSGNVLDGFFVSPSGIPFQKHSAFCLEAQRHPDAMNNPQFGSIILKPGEKYTQTTVYRFATK